jgi:hypothetical protein
VGGCEGGKRGGSWVGRMAISWGDLVGRVGGCVGKENPCVHACTHDRTNANVTALNANVTALTLMQVFSSCPGSGHHAA